MRRRDILTGAGSLATGATFVFPAPAIAQGVRQLKMVTDWPKEDTPGLHANSVSFARTIEFATGGRIKVEVFPSGSLVRPFETFDMVGAGIVDMYHTYEGYFVNKSRAFQFFAAIPFGLTANEQLAWVQYGGVKSCGTRSAANSTSSRSPAATPVPRWAAGSPARSLHRNNTRDCATGWPVQAPRCCGGWAPQW